MTHRPAALLLCLILAASDAAAGPEPASPIRQMQCLRTTDRTLGLISSARATARLYGLLRLVRTAPSSLSDGSVRQVAGLIRRTDPGHAPTYPPALLQRLREALMRRCLQH